MRNKTQMSALALAAMISLRQTSIAFEPDRAKTEDGADGYMVHFGH